MRNFLIAVSIPLPSLCTRSGTASNVPGESLPNNTTSCNGGEFARGRKFTLIHDECAGLEELLDASFGEVKSKRNRLGPGLRCTRALK